ncbi:hypothetical protein SLA2020_205260 [Shorea laevis]
MFWLTFLLPKSPLLLWGENACLCQKDQEHNLGLVLTSLKNVYHSLNGWGLENNIKVSAALDSECLRDDSGEKIIKPLLDFLVFFLLRPSSSTLSFLREARVFWLHTKISSESLDLLTHLVQAH